MIIAVNFQFKQFERSLKKIQGFNGIQTRDLSDTSAMLCQLSYEATHWERGQFVEFISPSLNYFHLLYLLVSTRALMGQFSGPYFPVRPAKFKVDSVAKLFCDLSPTVLNFYSK